MYEIFEKLLKDNGITAYKVSKETGISTATLTSWKKGNYTPKADKLQKIADYFGVSMEYLLTGQEPAPANLRADYTIPIGDSGESILIERNAPSPGDKIRADRRLMEYARRLLHIYDQLSDDGKLSVLNFASYLAAQEQEKKGEE